MSRRNGKSPESGKNGRNGKNGGAKARGNGALSSGTTPPSEDRSAEPRPDTDTPQEDASGVISETSAPEEAFIEEEASPDDEKLPKPGIRTPERLIEQRVTFVGELWAVGTPTSLIRRNVANAARAERDARAKARMSGGKMPPVVWGDVPPSDRTVDRLIERAKIETRLYGRSAKTTGEIILGKMLRSLDIAVQIAINKGDPRAIIHAVEARAKLLGMIGAITVRLGGEEDGAPIKQQIVQMSDMTEEEAFDELALYRQRAEERRKAAIESGEESASGTG
jgi:hypothetical protein